MFMERFLVPLRYIEDTQEKITSDLSAQKSIKVAH